MEVREGLSRETLNTKNEMSNDKAQISNQIQSSNEKSAEGIVRSA